jgi:predicted nucleic acid-binding protein
VIYLDSSAIVKLVGVESETAALLRWLGRRAGTGLVTSALSEVEVPRALRRTRPSSLASVAGVLRRFDRIDVSDAVRATAAAYTEPHLRSLDAIHVATAEVLVASGKAISAFVSYDRRQNEAARAAGLTIAAPGASRR